MATSLPKPDSEIDKPTRECGLCRRRVIEAVDAKGSRVVVEYCAPGQGTLGLVAALFLGEKIEAVKSPGTRYRPHRCPGTRAFSADARQPKRRCLVGGIPD